MTDGGVALLVIGLCVAEDSPTLREGHAPKLQNLLVRRYRYSFIIIVVERGIFLCKFRAGLAIPYSCVTSIVEVGIEHTHAVGIVVDVCRQQQLLHLLSVGISLKRLVQTFLLERRLEVGTRRHTIEVIDDEAKFGIVVSHHVGLALLVLHEILKLKVFVRANSTIRAVVAGIDHLLAVAGHIVPIEVGIEVGQRGKGEKDGRIVAAQVDAIGTIVEVHS